MSDDVQTSSPVAVRNTSSDTDKLIGNLCQRVMEQAGLERQTRVSFYAIIADILVLANLAYSSEVLKNDIDVRFQALAPKTELNQTLDYKLCVVVFNAKERDERKKAGKVGRVLPILRKETDGGVQRVIEHLTNNSGIEGLLKLHSSSSIADCTAKESKNAAETANADEAGNVESYTFDDEYYAYDHDDKEETSPGDERVFAAEKKVGLPVQDRVWLLDQVNKQFGPGKILLVEVEEDTLDDILELGNGRCVVQLKADFPEFDGFTPVKLVRCLVEKAS